MPYLHGAGHVQMYWISIIDVHVVHAGSNIFGQLKSGYMHIGCRYFITGTINCSSGCFDGQIGGRTRKISVFFDGETRAVDSPSRDVYLLPICEIELWVPNKDIDSRQWDHVSITGLVLEPTGERAGQYRRVGKFDLYGKDVKDLNCCAGNPNMQPKKSDYMSLNSDETSEHRYTIEII